MNHVDLESLVDVEEVDVDVVQGLVVFPQGLDQDGLAIEELPRDMTGHALQG